MSDDLGGSWSRLSSMAAAFGVFHDGGDSCYQIAHFSLSIEVSQKHLASLPLIVEDIQNIAKCFQAMMILFRYSQRWAVSDHPRI